MADLTNANQIVKQTRLSKALATVKYQLGCLRLIMVNVPPRGMVRRYAAYYLKRIALGGRLHTDGDSQADAARDRFRALAAKRLFTHDWFDSNIPIWTEKLTAFRNEHPQPDILEVGSFEGRSTLFLLMYFPTSRVTVVDPWEEADPYYARFDLASVEARFDANVAEHRHRVTKLRGRSAECLGKLVALGPSQFDLIYVDGSHYADDVIVDAALSWTLLRNGGMLIFDDYTWIDFQYGPKKSSCRAINLFLRLIEDEYRLEHVAHQVMIRKTRAIRYAAVEERSGA